jgi:hypothetical protein
LAPGSTQTLAFQPNALQLRCNHIHPGQNPFTSNVPTQDNTNQNMYKKGIYFKLMAVFMKGVAKRVRIKNCRPFHITLLQLAPR